MVRRKSSPRSVRSSPRGASTRVVPKRTPTTTPPSTDAATTTSAQAKRPDPEAEAETSEPKAAHRTDLISDTVSSVVKAAKQTAGAAKTSTHTPHWTAAEIRRVTQAIKKHGVSERALLIVHSAVHATKSEKQLRALLGQLRYSRDYTQYGERHRQPWLQWHKAHDSLVAPVKTWISQAEQMQLERGVADLSEECISVALSAIAKQIDRQYGASHAAKYFDTDSERTYRVGYRRIYHWLANVFYNAQNIKLPLLEPLEVATLRAAMAQVVETSSGQLQDRLKHVQELLLEYSAQEASSQVHTPLNKIDFTSINPLGLTNEDLILSTPSTARRRERPNARQQDVNTVEIQ